jgi:hypothetical protein
VNGGTRVTPAVRVPLGLLFFAWLYGTPFLFLVGMFRRMAYATVSTSVVAVQYGALTDRYLIGALALDVAAPLLGLATAAWTKDRYWARHFTIALAGMLLVLLAFAVASSAAAAPLIGSVPGNRVPIAPYTGCVAYSGGTNTCPGG